MTLCLNCLEPTTARPTPIGYAEGQRDPVHKTLVLCEACQNALISGDLRTFAGRFQENRTLQR